MSTEHTYTVAVRWTGNTGQGTASYRGYERAHEVVVDGLPPILGSSDPAYRGDASRYNPEQLLVASLSQCHMLAYLHLCADAGVVVVSYTDSADGTMVLKGSGGRFTEVMLHPVVTVADASMIERATALHDAVHDACFVASSVNFPVRCDPTTHAVASEVAG